MLLLTCCSAALLLLSQSGAAQKLQMSIPEARVCRPSVQQAHCTCVCSNIMETQAIQGQKFHQVFQSHQWHKLEQPEDGSVCTESHLKKGMSNLCLMLVTYQ